jgi:S-adenosylmethionine:diacylglycerol 3-amino-3-carboxypropyl transferase
MYSLNPVNCLHNLTDQIKEAITPHLTQTELSKCVFRWWSRAPTSHSRMNYMYSLTQNCTTQLSQSWLQSTHAEEPNVSLLKNWENINILNLWLKLGPVRSNAKHHQKIKQIINMKGLITNRRFFTDKSMSDMTDHEFHQNQSKTFEQSIKLILICQISIRAMNIQVELDDDSNSQNLQSYQ